MIIRIKNFKKGRLESEQEIEIRFFGRKKCDERVQAIKEAPAAVPSVNGIDEMTNEEILEYNISHFDGTGRGMLEYKE